MHVATSGAQRASRHRSILLGIGLALGLLVTAAPLASAAATRPWYYAETFYLNLMNCNRTGGTVSSSGRCHGRYSGSLRPLYLSAAMSDLTSRPYARALASAGACEHTYRTTLSTRLTTAGFRPSAYGENIACYNGPISATSFAVWAERAFQGERSYGGAHWKNIMNSRYRTVGIGIWVTSGKLRLVVDFAGWG